MTNPPPRIDGLVPSELRPRTRRILLEGLETPVDIGFHDFEVGNPQRICITAEVWVDETNFADEDTASAAWNYDFLRSTILKLIASRRYNLQETLVRAIYDVIASRQGVTGLRVSTRKLDVYPDCAAVGVELSSLAS